MTDRERAMNSLSDEELLFWFGRFGTEGLSRLQAERVLWLVNQVGRREAAAPRRMSRWEWQRLHESLETDQDLADVVEMERRTGDARRKTA